VGPERKKCLFIVIICKWVGNQLYFILSKKYVQGGASAGLSVDMVLFPLDTIKTRLQSAQGFIKSGGFSGVYKGIGPQAIGSAPQAALFFSHLRKFQVLR
jgi:hypothetical protein